MHNSTRNGFSIHRAVVQAVYPQTGECDVYLPAVLGSGLLRIPPTGLPTYDGSYVMPEVGSSYFLAIDFSGSVPHWMESPDSYHVWEHLTDTAASIGVLDGDITLIEEDLLLVHEELASARRYNEVGRWRMDNTLGGTPASGDYRYDTVLPGSASAIHISHTTTDNYDVDFILENCRQGDILLIQDADNYDNWQKFLITGTPTGSHALTYWSLPVSYDSSNGTGTTGFANNHLVSVSLLFTGLGGPLSHNDLTDLTTGDPHTQYGLSTGDTWTGTHNFTGIVRRDGTTAYMLINAGNYAASSPLTTTTSAQSIAGASVSLTCQAYDVIEAEGVFDVVTAAGIVAIGTLTINGSEQPAQALFKSNSGSDRATVMQKWFYLALSDGAVTFQLQGRHNTGGSGCTINSTHTQLYVKHYR